ncbi:hypothetical protein Bca4012_010464 [Brassica carinata]
MIRSVRNVVVNCDRVHYKKDEVDSWLGCRFQRFRRRRGLNRQRRYLPEQKTTDLRAGRGGGEVLSRLRRSLSTGPRQTRWIAASCSVIGIGYTWHFDLEI